MHLGEIVGIVNRIDRRHLTPRPSVGPLLTIVLLLPFLLLQGLLGFTHDPPSTLFSR